MAFCQNAETQAAMNKISCAENVNELYGYIEALKKYMPNTASEFSKILSEVVPEIGQSKPIQLNSFFSSGSASFNKLKINDTVDLISYLNVRLNFISELKNDMKSIASGPIYWIKMDGKNIENQRLADQLLSLIFVGYDTYRLAVKNVLEGSYPTTAEERSFQLNDKVKKMGIDWVMSHLELEAYSRFLDIAELDLKTKINDFIISGKKNKSEFKNSQFENLAGWFDRIKKVDLAFHIKEPGLPSLDWIRIQPNARSIFLEYENIAERFKKLQTEISQLKIIGITQSLKYNLGQ